MQTWMHMRNLPHPMCTQVKYDINKSKKLRQAEFISISLPTSGLLGK